MRNLFQYKDRPDRDRIPIIRTILFYNGNSFTGKNLSKSSGPPVSGFYIFPDTKCVKSQPMEDTITYIVRSRYIAVTLFKDLTKDTP